MPIYTSLESAFLLINAVNKHLPDILTSIKIGVEYPILFNNTSFREDVFQAFKGTFKLMSG